MSIRIGEYEFDGPHAGVTQLQDPAGVYAILDLRSDGKHWVLDIGESATVRTRVENHDRKDSWVACSRGVLHVAVRYTPCLQQAGRRAVEQRLRGLYDPPCGER